MAALGALGMTHTFAKMGVPPEFYDFARRRLLDAGYGHAVHDDGTLDMHGLALVKVESIEIVDSPRAPSLDEAWRDLGDAGRSLIDAKNPEEVDEAVQLMKQCVAAWEAARVVVRSEEWRS